MTFSWWTDAGLLQRFREGEPSALETVYRAHVNSVARTISSVLRRHRATSRTVAGREIASDVPDLVQEAFARAFEPEARRNFDGVREYGPYLRQIARNVAIDHLRRRWQRMVRDTAFLVDAHADGERPNEHPADLKTMALVGDYVAGLPPEIRQVHEALYVRGLSQREAAMALGLGRQAVRTLEARLRRGLRSVLEASEESPATSDTRPASVRGTGSRRQQAR